MKKYSRKELFEKFKKFVFSLKQSDRIAIVHDTDPDGCCSAALAFIGLKKIVPNAKFFFETQAYIRSGIIESTMKKLAKIKPDKIIIVDLAFHREKSGLEKLSKNAEILYIDHHEMLGDINSKKIAFINAEMISSNPGKYPAAKLCFDLFSKLFEMKKHAWLAGIGIFGDVSENAWKKFLKKSGNLKQMRKAADAICAVESLNEEKGIPKVIRSLIQSKSEKDFLKKGFLKYLKKYNKGMDKALNDFKKNSKNFPKIELVLYEVNAKNQMKSKLSTTISLREKSKTFVFFQKAEKGVYSISARRQDGKIAVNSLLQKAAEGFANASGGGHKAAAGGRVNEADLQGFKEKIIRLLEQKYK